VSVNGIKSPDVPPSITFVAPSVSRIKTWETSLSATETRMGGVAMPWNAGSVERELERMIAP